MTGCPKNPSTNSKYCADCQNSESPAITANSVSKETKEKLRKHRKDTSVFKETDCQQHYQSHLACFICMRLCSTSEQLK